MTIEAPNSLFATKAGRPKGRTGSRNKLATRFFEDVYSAWEEQGPSVIARAFFHDPVASMNMVARLMPQKIEHSVPTDGLSDERLGEMLDFAERMASLRADDAITIQARVLTDENRDTALSHEEGGGGPVVVNGCQGEKTPHTLRAAEAEIPDRPTNKLVHNQLATPPAGAEVQKGTAAPKTGGTPGEKTELHPARAAPSGRPPVGRPFPVPAHERERANRKALVVPPAAAPQDPIDPESLF